MSNAGQPPIFESPEALQVAIDGYFESCEGSIIPSEDEEGEPTIKRSRPITITGLALYLGFASRQSLYDYGNRDEYSYIIKKARMKVENAYEENLHMKNPTGSIFALKNMGWKDTQELTHNIPKGFMNIDPLADDQTDNSATEDSQA